MLRVIVLMMSLVPLAPAFAGNVTKELNGYNGLSVSISENAASLRRTLFPLIRNWPVMHWRLWSRR